MEDLGRRVERWVAAGVIRPEQGEAILALEAGSAEATEAAHGRRAVAVEVLGYLGGGLALVAGFVLGAESWAELGYWGRAGVLGRAHSHSSALRGRAERPRPVAESSNWRCRSRP